MGLTQTPLAHQPQRGRRVRIVVTLAVIAALCWPAVRNEDSYPLSTYPMYSTARAETTVFTIANGLDNSGERIPLTLHIIGVSDDPLIVAGELRAAVRTGEVDARCREIAERVSQSSDDDVSPDRIVAIEIASERHRTVEATRGEPSLVDRTSHTSCPVVDPR